jgi:signal transduction histidine kinase
MNAPVMPAILIVEDERIVAKDLQQALTDMGYDAFAIAASAEEAVACASAKCPDVVLMDIRIKGQTDGIQTAAILKRQYPVIVIYLTAHADEPMVDRAKKTEPYGYLLKPVKVAELRSTIEIALYRRELDQELRRSHERTRDLAQRLETVREEERRAVAVILHDGIAQDLFSMKLSLTHLESRAEAQAGIKQLCQEITSAVTKCMEATRQVAHELRPAALAYARVSTVIAEHGERFGKLSQLEITVTEADEFPQLDEPTRLLFFRAAQEALTNVARHAQATTVNIILRTEGGRIVMEIADNGIGISGDATNKPRSLGLLGLRERFAALGGGLIVQRREPTGTSVIVHLRNPLHEGAHAA